jgi:polar amino acid transport system permease protein
MKSSDQRLQRNNVIDGTGLPALPWEYFQSARVAQEQTYNPTPLTAAAIPFFVLLWPFARWMARLERDMIMRQK